MAETFSISSMYLCGRAKENLRSGRASSLAEVHNRQHQRVTVSFAKTRLNEAARAALKLVAARRLPRHAYACLARLECMDRCSQISGADDQNDFQLTSMGVAWRLSAIQLRCLRLRSEEHTSELQSRENLVCRL